MPPDDGSRTVPEASNAATRPLSGTISATGGDVDALIAWLRAYARERINSRVIDERRSIPPHIILDLGNRGLLGMQTSREYGGLGLRHVDAARIAGELGAIDLTLAVFVGNNTSLGIRPIERFGQPSLRKALLPNLASGRALAAFALTETGAGSNPRAITTRADLGRDGRFRVHGTKIWSGSASWAGVVNVFARTHDADGAFLGITGFAIEQGRSGVHVGPEALTLGMRGMVQNTLTFEGVVVDPGEVLGGVGDGLSVAQEAMTYCRLGLAAIAIGGMRRCVQLLHRYAGRRSVGTGPLLDNPVTKIRIAEMSAKTLALGCLVNLLAARLDDGEDVPPELFCACKVLGPEFLWQAADWLVQGLGGRGYMENNTAARILRDARVFRIFEGPTETIQMFLGTLLLASKGMVAPLAATGGDTWVVDRLAEAAAKLRSTGLRGRFEKKVAGSEWKSYLAGELYAWGLLASAVRKGSRRMAAEIGQQLVQWTEEEFANRCAKVTSVEGDRTAVLGAPFAEAVTVDLGDIEQRLPGEEQELDVLLRFDGMGRR